MVLYFLTWTIGDIKVSALLIKLPNEIICGGVLLPGQRVVTLKVCVPENYTDIKVQLRSMPGDLRDIMALGTRLFTAVISVSSSRHKKYDQPV